VSLFNARTPWWLTDAKTIDAASEEQAERYMGDPWQTSIATFVQVQDSVSIDDVLRSLGIDRSKWGQAEQNRVARCLKVLGWEKYRGPRPLREWRYRPVVLVDTEASDAKSDQ
jgi:predicted P-loop ATPase